MHGSQDIGSVLEGKYRLDRVIGQGGMGVVYQATHVLLNRQVAIKTIHRNLASDPRLIARLRQEAQLSASLGHPNICEVYDVGATTDGRPYLVMPFLFGETLTTALAHSGRLDPRRALDIIGQLLDALSAAHAARVLHRDLKPDNVFLITAGNRPDFVKLLDFGVSKAVDADLSLTTTGQIPGTPAYMAPEVLDAAPNIDQRSDIFSVGVILYELLLGLRPFTGGSYFEITNRIRNVVFKLPRAVDPNLPQVLESLVLGALAKDPEHRFRTALRMRSAITAVIPLLDKQEQSCPAPTPIAPEPALESPTVTDVVRTPPNRTDRHK